MAFVHLFLWQLMLSHSVRVCVQIKFGIFVVKK